MTLLLKIWKNICTTKADLSFNKGSEESSMKNVKEFPEIEEIKNSVKEVLNKNFEEISADINVEVIFIYLS